MKLAHYVTAVVERHASQRHTRLSIHARKGSGSSLVSRNAPARPGVALMMALVTLVIITMLVGVTWSVTLREFQASTGVHRGVTTAHAAEWGSESALSVWDPSNGASMAVGTSLTIAGGRLAGGAIGSWRVTRLNRTLFVAAGEGRLANGRDTTERRRALWLRLAIPDLHGPAALVARDSVRVAVGASVSGNDSTPATWSGTGLCSSGRGGVGVATPDTALVCDGTCGSGGGVGVTGAPPILLDAAAGDTLTYASFGAESWSTLTQRASVILPSGAAVAPFPTVTAGRCDRSVSSNWGDPTRSGPCADYFPILWAQGDVTLTGGVGQGVLLAEGDVSLAGGVEFLGVIVARDDIRTGPGGGLVYGAILAGDRRSAPGDHTNIAHATRIQRSSCALDRALAGSAPLVRVRGRSWAPLY